MRGKEIYIPKDLQGMDLQNPESKWSYHRMCCTDNVVVFWEKGFGNDLANPPQLEGHDMHVDLNNLTDKQALVSSPAPMFCATKADMDCI